MAGSSREADFAGKTALVTGVGKGIGRAIAVRLAQLGAKVFGISRTQADLDDLMKEVPSIETHLVDVADWDAVRNVVESIGPIDMLVNNAGILKNSPFLEVTREELNSTHEINFKAAFNVAQVVAQGMVARGVGGSVVNISSIAGQRALRKYSSYCTSKAALDMLTMTMAYELGPKKIRVNSVCPTLVMTAMGRKALGDSENKANILKCIPLSRLVEEEDVVNATVFLLDDRSSMINGALLPVDGATIVGCL